MIGFTVLAQIDFLRATHGFTGASDAIRIKSNE